MIEKEGHIMERGDDGLSRLPEPVQAPLTSKRVLLPSLFARVSYWMVGTVTSTLFRFAKSALFCGMQ